MKKADKISRRISNIINDNSPIFQAAQREGARSAADGGVNPVRFIKVLDADTEQDFLKNAEYAWKKKHQQGE